MNFDKEKIINTYDSDIEILFDRKIKDSDDPDIKGMVSTSEERLKVRIKDMCWFCAYCLVIIALLIIGHTVRGIDVISHPFVTFVMPFYLSILMMMVSVVASSSLKHNCSRLK